MRGFWKLVFVVAVIIVCVFTSSHQRLIETIWNLPESIAPEKRRVFVWIANWCHWTCTHSYFLCLRQGAVACLIFVIKDPTRSSLDKEDCILDDSLQRDTVPSWQRRQDHKAATHTTARRQRSSRKRGKESSRNPLPRARLHLLKVPQPFKSAPAAGSQGFESMIQWGTFYI